MKYAFTHLALTALFATSNLVTAEEAKPKIQIALLLDTSNSMDGLINQARTQLWEIINECDLARRDGVAPEVHVALYQYGNDSLPKAESWIQLVRPFSRDLDLMSESLFSLSTNGGTEYCGATIQQALAQLQWDNDDDTYRAIFIAGNESFAQGPTTPISVAKLAHARGIVLNSIHCGPLETGISDAWNDAPSLAGGAYFAIDQSKTEQVIPTPHDAQIAALNVQLNATYLAYGKNGRTAQIRQAAIDTANENAGQGAIYKRAKTKANANYYNASWDLVDAARGENFDVTTIAEQHLPDELKGLTADEKLAYINALREKRKNIQTQIRTLAAARDKFIAEKRTQLAGEDGQALDDAIVAALRTQMQAKGFDFDKK